MKKSHFFSVFFILLFFSELKAQDIEPCFPSELLPDHITQLTDFGQRAEWSLDGTKVYFVNKAGGDVFVVDVDTKETRRITDETTRPPGHGYYRVFVMWNGDLILGHGPERHKLWFQVLDSSLEFPAQIIEGEYFDEGIALSRTTSNLAWTTPGQKQIYSGQIVYNDEGEPEIVNKELIIDNTRVITTDGNQFEEILETQDLVPGSENILVWNQYHRNEFGFRSDIMTIDMETQEIVNHTKAPNLYHESEGIFPNRETTNTTLESDQHNPTQGTGTIDIYKLEIDREVAKLTTDYELDDTMERMTYFSDADGYRSSNPVISDDGNWMVFQGSISGTDAGVGCGLYLYNLNHKAN